jgi:hypothetical protein
VRSDHGVGCVDGNFNEGAQIQVGSPSSRATPSEAPPVPHLQEENIPFLLPSPPNHQKRIAGDMEQLKIQLSPAKLSTLFLISKSVTKAVIDKDKLKLLTPLQKVSEKMAVQDILPNSEYGFPIRFFFLVMFPSLLYSPSSPVFLIKLIPVQ